jgi:hypothetical protein
MVPFVIVVLTACTANVSLVLNIYAVSKKKMVELRKNFYAKEIWCDLSQHMSNIDSIAIFGKQGWKLVTQHDALIKKLFKARYFLRIDILNAHIGHNLSYCCRSLWSMRAHLKEGGR